MSAPYHWSWETKTRYYSVKIEIDLLGDWIVTQQWGGRFNHRRGEKKLAYPTLQAALDHVDSIKKRRKQHHYDVVAPNNKVI